MPKKDIKAKIEQAYKARTHNYDDILTGRKWWSRLYMKGLWGVDDNAIAREVLAMIPDQFQGRILDIPVGTGIFTFEKYSRMEHAEIIGIDYSQEMLDVAKARWKDSSLPSNILLERGDVCHLPFPDESFDTVLSMNGFHAFPPQKESAFAETRRVLKSGGVFFGCFYIKGERALADWVVRNILNKKGFFTPPHYTRQQIKDLLHTLYNGQTVVTTRRSIVLFRCTKP